MNIKINQNLKNYMEELIDYHYNLNDKGHGIDHVNYVINRSFDFAKQIPEINYEMVYVVAAYHDVAHHIDDENHEALSAKMLSEDERLMDFFTEEQIQIMSEAVADHRASSKTEPRNIYGKIVSSADRNTSVENTLKRCYLYNRKLNPELKLEETIEECRKALVRKFGIGGYARNKMYFNDEKYTKYLDEITNLTSNSEKFAAEIKRANDL